MRTLGKINVVGTMIPVVEATAEEVGSEVFQDFTYAAFEWKTSTIYLRKWDDLVRPASPQFSDLVHEFLHATFIENGARHALKLAFPHLTADAIDALEETLIRCISPAIVTAIDNLSDMRNVLAALEVTT